jgi:cell division protein FtsI (penicillin-binding protein 3)
MYEVQVKRGRFYFVITLLVLALMCLLWRLIDLGIIQRHFLLQQSQSRTLRHIQMPAYRGMVVDRLGSPLAISSPVESVWVNPHLYKASFLETKHLAALLGLSPRLVQLKIKHNKHHSFVYLKRQNPPAIAQKVRALKLAGIFTQKEYKRFYPEGEVSAHVVGITNIDDHGQEGLELAYDKWLSGTPGRREVVKDPRGNVVQQLAILKQPQQGHNLTLSIDHRIQYLAYQAIKQAVKQYHAKSGSIVVLNPQSGEVLAMVNAPSYNPNDRPPDTNGRYRNRAVTDMFEPGSVIKPFNIALALDSGKYTPNSTIDTSPGRMHVGHNLVVTDDGLNYGVIDLTTVLQKSSNIGAAKILMSLPASHYWNLLHRFGFGRITRSNFPGESAGKLVPQDKWYPSVVATLAYGYGIATTTLQLAHAYAILANHGVDMPITLLKRQKSVAGKSVVSAGVADEVVEMLKAVVERGGTGSRAGVSHYSVAGKTGTAYISNGRGYDKHRYISSFVGIAPVKNPRLVVAVVVHEPKGQHFGGLVSAPVFAKVMAGALRALDVAPDH